VLLGGEQSVSPACPEIAVRPSPCVIHDETEGSVAKTKSQPKIARSKNSSSKSQPTLGRAARKAAKTQPRVGRRR